MRSLLPPSILAIATFSSCSLAAVSFPVFKNPAHSGISRRHLSSRSSITESLANNLTGGSYNAAVTVGTPAQSLILAIDTGSSDVWMLANTADLCTSPELENQDGGGCTTPYQSSSLAVIAQGGFQIQYEDGSGSEGDYITDNLVIGGTTVANLQMGLAYNTTVPIGLLGIGYDTNEASQSVYPNIIDDMFSQGLITTKAYSLYLDDLEASTGSIIFGGLDSSKYVGSLTALDIQPDQALDGSSVYAEFIIALTSFGVESGGKVTSFSGSATFAEPVVLDSGTTITYLPDQVAEDLFDSIGAVDDVSNTGNVYVDCDLTTSNSSTTFNYGFGGASGTTIKVPISELVFPLTGLFAVPEGYLPELPFTSPCGFGIQPADGGTNLLGDTFLRSAYVVYDLESNQIAIGQSNFNSGSSNIVEFQAGASSIPDVSGVASSIQVTGTATGVLGGGGGGGGKTTDSHSASVTILSSVTVLPLSSSSSGSSSSVLPLSSSSSGSSSSVLPLSSSSSGSSSSVVSLSSSSSTSLSGSSSGSSSGLSGTGSSTGTSPASTTSSPAIATSSDGMSISAFDGSALMVLAISMIFGILGGGGITASATSCDYQKWDHIRSTLLNCKKLNAGGKLSRGLLLAEFRGLQRDDCLILHVTEQNAGITIQRKFNSQGDNVIFEAFEASPLSEKVLASKSALQWNFPGCAVSIPFTVFSDPYFQDNMAVFLEQASVEPIKQFAARTMKANSLAVESRDTVNPAIITQMLMTLLEVNGRRCFPSLLCKRVRDDVCWAPGAEKPWRRLPFWLVLRVGIQRHLCCIFGDELGQIHYKFLVCVLIADMIDEAKEHLHPESLVFLKAKLCRRLSKLETDKEQAESGTKAVYEYIFTALGSMFQKVIITTTEKLEADWASFRKTIQKPILPLPRHADRRDMYLTLPNSGRYLEQVLKIPLVQPGSHPTFHQLPSNYASSRGAINHPIGFASRYFALSELEARMEDDCSNVLVSNVDYEGKCLGFAEKINEYLATASDVYEFNPEQKSVMILTIMELWMSMDICMTSMVGLLKDYNPAFPSDILDVLQVTRLSEMKRLHKIEVYLQERHANSNSSRMSVFNDPQKEWAKLSNEYEALIKTIAESTCLYTTDDLQPLVREHDDRQCTKCYLERKSRRMRINVHEHPLPANPVQAKAVVFELGCPRAFSSYRDATWKILSALAHPNKSAEGVAPLVQLRDYSELQAHRNPASFSLSLASTTKSFLSTHYSSVRLPANLEDVCLPNGLKLGYFDIKSKLWTGREHQLPTFANHCQITISPKSSFSSFQFSPNFAVESEGPSSYEIIASQTKCPSGLNIHEFMAFQSLFSGKIRRWPTLIVELGSANLNFSSEAVVSKVSQLALQAGPPLHGDPLRAIHVVFRDVSFCKRLLEQVNNRLDGVSSNWRETNAMEMFILLALRLCHISPEENIVREAIILLEKARSITLKWMHMLEEEMKSTNNVDASLRCSQYAFYSALLCRKTFDFYTKGTESLGPSSLLSFINASIVLQNNLVGDPGALSRILKNAFVRDLKMVYRLGPALRHCLEANPDTLKSILSKVYPEPEGNNGRIFSAINFLPSPDQWWVLSVFIDASNPVQQTIHYHLLEGHLLVNGQALGKLPLEYRKSEILEQLFGNQSLLTYTSTLPGMKYVLAVMKEGHQIHVGFRNGDLIVHACKGNAILELIPPRIFRGQSSFDLPASLVDNCVHWLDLHTGLLEVRQKPEIWRSKHSNWILDFSQRKAQRRGTSILIDPQSRVFQRVARIFDRFEHAQQLTVFEAVKGGLTVELRRLELSFWVNKNNLLQSSQLRQEIDPNQDAGTWYGLNSKLVLRDIDNPSGQRSIIVPTGYLHYKKHKLHVAIDINSNGEYGKFTINDVLGRIDCHAEPLLLYLKAQLHAYTSFVLPDPLTKRTGTEEALHSLSSGYSQPWTPLRLPYYEILTSIAKLTPRREYYPKDIKVMQQVSWDNELTASIQSSSLEPVISKILEKSAQLMIFAAQKTPLPALEPAGNLHLLERSHLRQLVFERSSSDFIREYGFFDVPYDARDGCWESQIRNNVLEAVTLLHQPPSKISTTLDLAGILQTWPNIGGYDRTFEKVLLSDRLAVDLPLEWGALVNVCRYAAHQDKYWLMFLLSTISFRADIDMRIVRTLISFSIFGALKDLTPPVWPSYVQFRSGRVLQAESLIKLMQPFCVSYEGDELFAHRFSMTSKRRKNFIAAEIAFEKQKEEDCKEFAQFLLDQWPCPDIEMESFYRPLLIDFVKALEVIRPEWQRLYQNLELSKYIKDVQLVLDCQYSDSDLVYSPINVPDQKVLPRRRQGVEVPSLSRDLIRKTCSFSPNGVPKGNIIEASCGRTVTLKESRLPITLQKSVDVESEMQSTFSEIQELETIISTLSQSQSSTVRQNYGHDLMQSLEALKLVKNIPSRILQPIAFPTLPEQIAKARSVSRQNFRHICDAFELGDPRAKWLKSGNLWPCLTPITVLELLRSTAGLAFGDGMKECIFIYAISITSLQRLLRLENAYKKGNDQRFREEQENEGHLNWDPRGNPDWLLLEIDANFLIRPGQIDVAIATIAPISRSNSVLQMNMGQGKTSCIIPMVAAALADSKRLLRVIVPKPLLLQSARLLHSRIGGLVGRETRHVQFSRKSSTKAEAIKIYHKIHEDILNASGVILALPEHMLSFMLSGRQRLIDSRISEAIPMIKIQTWLSRKCRDVLDESDYTLAVRTQLIYPSGSQSTVEGAPHRWEAAEAVLGLVEGHLFNLQNEFPQSIDVIKRQGGFPIIFLLRKDVEDALLARIVDDVCSGRTVLLPTRDCNRSDRSTIRQFISSAKIQPRITERIRNMFPDKPAARQNIYLLRGLLVHRILLLTLKKRWNVQYGLHPSRDPIAVPFHAKGIPSDNSEFGHPDVGILFTCLAFYYDGLSLSQLRQSLESVLKSDDPSSQYDRWTHTSQNLPDSLRDANAINVDDEGQLVEIWKHVRYNVVVIDYFLNSFVFPKHSKQFRTKLQASGWDIPLFTSTPQSSTGQQNLKSKSYEQALTTGFSGTNDNRTMLPLTIKQQDLLGLSHTNAEVLTYLLQARNRQYIQASDHHGRHLTEIGFLHRLKGLQIRVLIDAGAMILEMDNLALARAWLEVDYEASAAVYFDAENKPMVIYRKGHKVPLLATPFADNLDNCLLYLDESHTRGTDLVIGPFAKGALTLGLGQTKDHTVQAAMRLRQLATTQSVMFFAPPEVHQSILDIRQKKQTDYIDSRDVIYWLLEQTCNGIEQLQPLYYSQGTDFCRRTQASLANPNYLTDEYDRDGYLDVLRQTELQSLEQMYEPRTNSIVPKLKEFSPEVENFMKELKLLRRGFQDNGTAVNGVALQEVEQEREVAYEVEAVREVQKPIHYSPLKFPGLHKDLVNFVKTGRVVAGAMGPEHALLLLRKTELGRKYAINVGATTSKFYVSQEFTRTVNTMGRRLDNFLRPVNWILWSVVTDSALVITPEEAEQIIPIVRTAKKALVHLLTYAAPVTRKMLHFNEFSYYAIPSLPQSWEAPSWLKIELGLFAGRLYFNYEEYQELTEFVGLGEQNVELAESIDDFTSFTEIDTEDDTSTADRLGDIGSQSLLPSQGRALTAKPMTFLQEWLAMRRKGQDFTHTPMGYVCQGKPLTPNNPFFGKTESDSIPRKAPSHAVPKHQATSKDAIDESSGEDSGEEEYEEGFGDVGEGNDVILYGSDEEDDVNDMGILSNEESS
ncbi:hypothetical protein B7494_g3109 [Chlorociboria aeruginascens]|nr:hypothetical protein B7494_g3109 [Chlorociboria aeruginascens]